MLLGVDVLMRIRGPVIDPPLYQLHDSNNPMMKQYSQGCVKPDCVFQLRYTRHLHVAVFSLWEDTYWPLT